MLFTRDFIFLAYPKTGSSYVRKVVKETGIPLKMHHHLLPKSLWPKQVYYEQWVWRDNPPGWEQHGSRSQIFEPISRERHWVAKRVEAWKREGERRIVSVWRDPIEWIVSAFRFQFYATWVGEKRDEVKSVDPHFPDWTLPEYYEWAARKIRKSVARRLPLSEGNDFGIGALGWSFILFYASAALLERWREDWPNDAPSLLAQFEHDVQGIQFLHQSRLTDELGELLRESGLAPQEGRPVAAERVNPTRENHRFTSTYEISEEDLQAIREQEQFLLLFAERRSLNKTD